MDLWEREGCSIQRLDGEWGVLCGDDFVVCGTLTEAISLFDEAGDA